MVSFILKILIVKWYILAEEQVWHRSDLISSICLKDDDKVKKNVSTTEMRSKSTEAGTSCGGAGGGAGAMACFLAASLIISAP